MQLKTVHPHTPKTIKLMQLQLICNSFKIMYKQMLQKFSEMKADLLAMHHAHYNQQKKATKKTLYFIHFYFNQ